MIPIGDIDALRVRRDARKARTRKTGPNDVRRVVWAISEYFFKNYSFFYILNDVYSTHHITGEQR